MCKYYSKLKIVLLFVLTGFFIFSFSCVSFAEDSTSFYNNENDFSVELNEEAKDIMSQIGIEDADYDELMSLSPRRIISYIIDLLKGEIKTPFITAGAVLAIAALITVIGSFVKGQSSADSINTMIGSFLIISVVSVPVSNVLTAAASSVKLTSEFMLSYIPALAGIVSASGMPLTSAAYSAGTIGLAEIIMQLCSKFFFAIISIILSMVFLSSLYNNFNSEKIIGLFKKFITVALSLLAVVFVGMITIKGNLASSADSVAIKGIKLIAGNAIPIVGGAVGDAYTSILGSMTLIKNTVGSFGIIAICIINIPIVAELLLWYFAINICSVFCEILGNQNGKKILDGISSAVVLVNTITIFSAVIFILATGVVVSLKG